MTEYKTLLVDVIDDIAIITLNQPKKLNSVTDEMLKEMNDIFTMIEQTEKIKVAILTGAGEKAFCAGSDVQELAQLDPAGAFERMRLGQKMNLRINEFQKPVIAMVNGYALGGGFELALACDLLVASKSAKFGFPEINLNTFPGWGGTQMATKKMGPNRAKEMVLTGNYYTADECWNFGFINIIATQEQLYEATLSLVQTIAAKEAYCLRLAKDCVNHGDNLDLSTGFTYEAQAYAVNFSMDHRKEGFANFLNSKR